MCYNHIEKVKCCFMILIVSYRVLFRQKPILASGNRWGSTTQNVGNNANVWSSSLNINNPDNAMKLNFNSGNVNANNNNNRNNGYAVRGILAFYRTINFYYENN